MTTKSPLEQAQERILELEAGNERLEREKECLSWNYAQSESLTADLRQERDALALAPARLSGILARFRFHPVSPQDDMATVERNLVEVLEKFEALKQKCDALRRKLRAVETVVLWAEKADALAAAVERTAINLTCRDAAMKYREARHG